MKLIDVNLLLYAYDSSSFRHKEARAFVEEILSGTQTVGLTWVVLLAFVRLSTRSAVFENPLTIDEAIGIILSWLDQPVTTVVNSTERHIFVLGELLAQVGTGGNLTTDAHLAALAIEHGAELMSCDPDFSRFKGLQWKDPLRAP